MFRGSILTRVAAALGIALLALAIPANAATNLVEPKGPKWVCGSEALANFAAPYLAKATPQSMGVHALKAPKTVHIGEKETFWSMNMVASQPFQLQAVLRKISEHSYMYVQEGYDVDDATLEKLGKQFDNTIWPTDHAYFGSEINPGIDGDPRITLLFLDIVDGWQPGKGYVAGYFFPLDEMSTSLFPQSNEREMFYLDLNPGDPKRDDYLGVLAHEFQHMIHFAHDPKETRWLNESLAQLAFFVNGYGHAPQIFSYIHDTNSNFERFDNTLEDYGRSYLFIYYLYSHYAGSTDAERQAFVKDLVASKLQGPASIAEVLKAHGVTKSLEDIKSEWFLANVMNPASPADPNLGYDDSIRFAVQSAKLYDLHSLPEQETQDVVFPDAAKIVTVDTKIRYTPDHPTMVDKVKIFSDAPGNLTWNVNDGEMPPQRLIPAGSTTTQDNTVSTPLAKDGCCYSTVLGNFARLGKVIKKVNYQVPDAKTTQMLEVPIFSLAAIASAGDKPVTKLTFKFAGDTGSKAKFTLHAVQFAADGNAKLSKVELNDKNTGSFDCDLAAGRVSFVVRALSGDKKGVKFSYSVVPAAAKNSVENLIAAGTRLASIDTKLTLGDVDSDPAAKALYGDLLKAREENVVALADKLATDPEATRVAAGLVAGANSHDKDAYNTVLKAALKRARFEALDGGQVSEELKLAMLAPPTKGDDGDDSHDNLKYLINKKNENIHDLTHLQIDPNFLEGQLFKLWKLLELVRGFPHLPLPDGLGIVDYNEQKAKDLIGQWAADFGIPNTGTTAPAARPVAKTADLEKVKTVMRRLILAESIIQFAYNNSLTLAEETAVSVYDIVRLLLTANKTITDISAHFEHVPIVGAVAKALRQRILSKVLGVGEKFAVYMCSRLPPKYAAFAPIIVMVVANVASRVLGVPIEHVDQGQKDFAVKLFGKYALASVPKIGFVARSQASIDLATEYASGLTANGTLEDAQKKVWDDGTSDTNSSIREVIGTTIAAKAKLSGREREIAHVAQKISQILAYASLLDPTNITRIVGVVAAVASGGLLAHSTWNNASYYFALPKHEMLDGVRLAYDPASAAAPAAETVRRVKMNAAYNTKVLGELRAAYDVFQAAAADVLAAAEAKNVDGKGLAAKVDALLQADARVDFFGTKCESLALSREMLKDDTGTQALYNAAQTDLMRRTTILADALARVAGARPAPSVALSTGPDAYLSALSSNLKVSGNDDDAAASALVSRSDIEKKGDELVVFATLSNLSNEAITGITVKLVSGVDFTVNGDEVHTIANLPAGDERQVAWRIKVTETTDLVAPQLAVVAEAEGVNILPKFQNLPTK